MLEIRNLMVFYENAVAINNVNMRCKKGVITGAFGANSAGKSTLMYTISVIILDMKKKEEMRGGERITVLGGITYEGSDIMNMEITYGLPGPGPWNVAGQPAFRQPNLMVNLLGERFINEELMENPTFTGNAIARQKNRCAFILFDETTKKHYEDVGLDFMTLGSPFKEQDLDADIKQAFDQGNKNIFVEN